MSFWDELKADEKPHRTSVLDGIPRGMPALALAQKVLGKAEKVGVTVPVDRVEPVPDAAGASAPATEAELGATLERVGFADVRFEHCHDMVRDGVTYPLFLATGVKRAVDGH